MKKTADKETLTVSFMRKIMKRISPINQLVIQAAQNENNSLE